MQHFFGIVQLTTTDKLRFLKIYRKLFVSTMTGNSNGLAWKYRYCFQCWREPKSKTLWRWKRNEQTNLKVYHSKITLNSLYGRNWKILFYFRTSEHRPLILAFFVLGWIDHWFHLSWKCFLPVQTFLKKKSFYLHTTIFRFFRKKQQQI